MFNDITKIMEIETSLMMDMFLNRQEILKDCKTDEERMRYREMWSAEDNANKIARAIRSTRHRGLFF